MLKVTKITFFIFLMFLLSMNIFASDVSDLVKKYESEVEAEISKQDKSEEDKYYIYALFARELLGLKEYDLAKKYYQKALAAGEKGEVLNMSEVHYNMLFIRFKQGAEKEELKSLFSLVKRTLPEQNNIQIKLSIQHWESIINNNEKLNEKLVNSFYGANYSQAMVKKFIANKEYKKALSLMPKNIDDVNLVFKIQYDILNRIVFDKKKDLKCEKHLKEFPRSVSYTMKICRFLTQEKSKESIETIEKQMVREKSSQDFLLSALKDVK